MILIKDDDADDDDYADGDDADANNDVDEEVSEDWRVQWKFLIVCNKTLLVFYLRPATIQLLHYCSTQHLACHQLSWGWL